MTESNRQTNAEKGLTSHYMGQYIPFRLNPVLRRVSSIDSSFALGTQFTKQLLVPNIIKRDIIFSIEKRTNRAQYR